MIRNIVPSILETLGGAAKATTKQAGKQVKKTGDDIAIELGLKPLAPIGADTTQPLAAHTDQQVDRLKEITNRRIASKYQSIQQEIAHLQRKRVNELPAYITGSAQFDKDKAVQQMEVANKPSATLSIERPKEDKAKLPPIAVRREQSKAERHRGSSG